MSNFFDSIPQSVVDKVDGLKLDITDASCNEEVKELLGRTVLSGGKRLRPLLTYMFAELFDLDSKAVNECAASIEMVHAASLAHDDVVDNATQRRGEPSINIVASNKKAVLSGDYLLSDVISRLATLGDLKILQNMSSVIKELAIGEWLQSDAIITRDYSREFILKIAQHKTASVMSFCTWAPAHLSGSTQNVVDAAYDLGRNLGLAFQLMDDTLDFSDDSQKDLLLDIDNNIVNSVILEWLLDNPTKFSDYKAGTDLKKLWVDVSVEKYVDLIKNRAISHIEAAHNCLNIISSYLEDTKGMDSKDLDEKTRPIKYIMSFIINRNF